MHACVEPWTETTASNHCSECPVRETAKALLQLTQIVPSAQPNVVYSAQGPRDRRRRSCCRPSAGRCWCFGATATYSRPWTVLWASSSRRCRRPGLTPSSGSSQVRGKLPHICPQRCYDDASSPAVLKIYWKTGNPWEKTGMDVRRPEPLRPRRQSRPRQRRTARMAAAAALMALRRVRGLLR